MPTVIATLPTIRNGSAAIYPVQRSTLITTAVQRFINASEQRFKRHAPLGQFQLVYKGLFAVDRDALKAFFDLQPAEYLALYGGWSFTLASITYPKCVFIDDSFTSVESDRPNLYDVTLRFRQTQTGGIAAFPAGPSFPVLSTGATAQRPYTQIVRYRTTKNDNPTGIRYAYAWYGNAALTGFPPNLANRSGGTDADVTGLMGWKLEFPSITDADMALLEAFFVAMNGRWQTFSFTDPDSGTTFSKVRFDQDSFVYNYTALNQASTTIQLVETN